jgi:hypothetical protein
VVSQYFSATSRKLVSRLETSVSQHNIKMSLFDFCSTSYTDSASYGSPLVLVHRKVVANDDPVS